MAKNLFKHFFVVISILFMTYPVFAAAVPEIKITQESGNTLGIYVEDAQDLAGFEIELSYDKNHFQVKSIQAGSLLQNSQRTFNLLGPKIDPSGKVAFGFFSIGNVEGVRGNGVLVSIGYGGDPSSLKIQKVQATDSNGNILLSK